MIKFEDFDSPFPDDYYTFIETKVDVAATADAQKFAKYAISALMFDDIPTAISNLEAALKTLEPYRS